MKKALKVFILTVVLSVGTATFVSAQVPPPTPPPTFWGRVTKAISDAENWVIKVTRDWPRMQ